MYHITHLPQYATPPADMADNRRAKLQRLSDFRRSMPHVSGRAFSSVLQHIRDHGLPELMTRRNQREARDITTYQETPYGTIVETVQLPAADGGAPYKLELVNPLALLHHASATPGNFTSFSQSRLARQPPSPFAPWHIALYSDGITPGDAFRTSNERKVDAIYFSFLEFGGAALAHEDSWFTLVTKRSVEVAAAAGQLSKVMSIAIKSFFGPIHNLKSGGIMFTFPGGSSAKLWADLDICVQDELAHKMTWCCKGATGLRSCMLCVDYAEPSSELAQYDVSGTIRCHIMRPKDLALHSDESLRAVLYRLRDVAATYDDTVLHQKESLWGFRHDPDNLLLDASLDNIVLPVSQYMHDWMHVVMIGVFPITLHKTTESMRHRFRFTEIDEYLKCWRWPSRVGGQSGTSRNIFDAKHEGPSRKNKAHKCSASEGLSVYLILAHLLRKLLVHADAIDTATINVFLALVFLIELLQNIPRGSITATALEAAVERFMTLYVALYGWDGMITKFHALLHLVLEFARKNTLLSCWVHERKHKTLKRYAQNICDGNAYEKSLIGEVTAHHLWALRTSHAFKTDIGLVEPHDAPPRMLQHMRDIFGDMPMRVRMGHASRFDPFSICVRGDIVVLRTGDRIERAGEVWFHFEINDVPVSIINTWHVLEAHETYATFQCADNPEMWDTTDIIANCISCRDADVVTVLLPRR